MRMNVLSTLIYEQYVKNISLVRDYGDIIYKVL